MIDVACFCGFSYSFEGEAGSCPNCGEPVTIARASGRAPKGHEAPTAQLTQRESAPPEKVAA